MNGNDVLNGIGKGIGGLLLAAVGEDYVDDVCVSEEYEGDSTFNTSTSRSRLSATIEASNATDDGNVEGQDTFTTSNSLAVHSSLDDSGIEDDNGDGRGVVGTVATFLFNQLTGDAADDLYSSFDTCNASATDVDISGIAEQSNLTSSYTSRGLVDVDSRNESTESKDITPLSNCVHATKMTQAEKDTNTSDSIEQQSQKAASAALMLAQTGRNETNNNKSNRSGLVCDDNECTAEKKEEINAISLALPLDATAMDTPSSSVQKVLTGGGDNILGTESSIDIDGTKDESDVWQSLSMDVSSIGLANNVTDLQEGEENNAGQDAEDKPRTKACPPKRTTELKQSQGQIFNALVNIERAINEAKARAADINANPSTGETLPVVEEVSEASKEKMLSNKETSRTESLYTPETSAWGEELAPRDDDLKTLERRLREARLESTNVDYTDRPTVPTSSQKNVIGQSSKRSSRIRDKALKLKAARKGSRYNGDYARKTTKPTTNKRLVGSGISPVKPTGGTALGADNDLADEISPAKTADITEDASIGFGSAEKNAVEEEGMVGSRSSCM